MIVQISEEDKSILKVMYLGLKDYCEYIQHHCQGTDNIREETEEASSILKIDYLEKFNDLSSENKDKIKSKLIYERLYEDFTNLSDGNLPMINVKELKKELLNMRNMMGVKRVWKTQVKDVVKQKIKTSNHFDNSNNINISKEDIVKLVKEEISKVSSNDWEYLGLNTHRLKINDGYLIRTTHGESGVNQIFINR